ncbi:alpha/beta hydrolase [Paraburkholderia dipogonis]|uniref:Alpha/beta hydrolase n=2 Tax=Paraburkholderia dipogonis TaxID=1211383 RepID=A0A4Y8MY48_9BURK|nr:alpha/beta hydrolase [Paraburkholderia dipogonis]
MKTEPFNPSRLAPEVREVLAAIAASGAPSLAALPFPQMRKAYKQLGVTLGGDSLPVREIRELRADGPAGPIPLRLYLPEANVAADAVTVYVHGGGWSIGDLDSHDKICRRLARAAGCAVVGIDYRLAPEHPAPAGPEDVLAAIRWLSRHAVELDLDPRRMAVAGDSAGGSLSAMACQKLRGEPFTLRAQVLFYPSTDLSPRSWNFSSRRENGSVPPLTLDLMRVLSDPFCVNFNTKDPRLSPLLEHDLSNLPPALIVTAECDLLRDDGRFYRDALGAAGVPVEYFEVPGMIHGFLEMAGVLPVGVQTIDRAGKFLRAHLA